MTDRENYYENLIDKSKRYGAEDVNYNKYCQMHEQIARPPVIVWVEGSFAVDSDYAWRPILFYYWEIWTQVKTIYLSLKI